MAKTNNIYWLLLLILPLISFQKECIAIPSKTPRASNYFTAVPVKWMGMAFTKMSQGSVVFNGLFVRFDSISDNIATLLITKENIKSFYT